MTGVEAPARPTDSRARRTTDRAGVPQKDLPGGAGRPGALRHRRGAVGLERPPDRTRRPRQAAAHPIGRRDDLTVDLAPAKRESPTAAVLPLQVDARPPASERL